MTSSNYYTIMLVFKCAGNISTSNIAFSVWKTERKKHPFKQQNWPRKSCSINQVCTWWWYKCVEMNVHMEKGFTDSRGTCQINMTDERCMKKGLKIKAKLKAVTDWGCFILTLCDSSSGCLCLQATACWNIQSSLASTALLPKDNVDSVLWLPRSSINSLSVSLCLWAFSIPPALFSF